MSGQWWDVPHLYTYGSSLKIRPTLHYGSGIWKWCFHSEIASNAVTGHFGLVFKKKNSATKLTWLSWGFQRASFSKWFKCPHGNAKPAFWDSSCLKSGFEKLRFLRPNRRNIAAFSNYSGGLSEDGALVRNNLFVSLHHTDYSTRFTSYVSILEDICVMT